MIVFADRSQMCVMVPAGMADMDVVRAGVLRQHIARQHAGDADRGVAVALAILLGDLERGGPAIVGQRLWAVS